MTVGKALAAASEPQAGASSLRAMGALESSGITLLSDDRNSERGRSIPRIKVDPRTLRTAYPTSARLEPHTFLFTLDAVADPSRGGAEDADDFAADLLQPSQETRYCGGICEMDELRVQVEVLRRPLDSLGLSIDQGLDELCAGLQSPCARSRARCDSIVQELEIRGVRFFATPKSWRLPRAGVLLIEDPEALVRICPELEFFEPHRFSYLPIVDRPVRACNEVRQGLLF